MKMKKRSSSIYTHFAFNAKWKVLPRVKPGQEALLCSKGQPCFWPNMNSTKSDLMGTYEMSVYLKSDEAWGFDFCASGLRTSLVFVKASLDR